MKTLFTDLQNPAPKAIKSSRPSFLSWPAWLRLLCLLPVLLALWWAVGWANAPYIA